MGGNSEEGDGSGESSSDSEGRGCLDSVTLSSRGLPSSRCHFQPDL
jgi:hypothetical protein